MMTVVVLPVVMMVMVISVVVIVLMGMIMRVAATMLMVMSCVRLIVVIESGMAMPRVPYRSECQRRAAPAAPELEELRRQQIEADQGNEGIAYALSWFDQALI